MLWFRDPLPYFNARKAAPGGGAASDGADEDDNPPDGVPGTQRSQPRRSRVETLWSDDGARSNRYAPYSANTGLYFLRSCGRTHHFMRSVLHSFDLMLEWRSHQRVAVGRRAPRSAVGPLRPNERAV